MKTTAFCLLLIVLFLSCSEPVPKPKGFQRVVRQPVEFVQFNNPKFSFLYPSDARIRPVESDLNDGFGFDMLYPKFNATLYFTYIPLHNSDLSKVLDDSYKFAYSHVSVAQSILQTPISDTARHVYGIIYDIKGSVASPVQFYATDSTTNFLRGSLYFDQIVESDSVTQIVSFIREDIVRMVESLVWVGKKSARK